MKKMVICKACGYIIQEGKLGDRCPACGVPKTAFIPYEDRLSPKRRKILNLHLHNIMVHFPQAFAVLMLFSMVMVFNIRGVWQADFMITVKILSIFLPISVLGSIITGMLDGKTRFKRLNTRVLKKKIMLGTIFLVFSIGILLALNLSALEYGWRLLALALTALCVLASMVLGYNGGRLAGLEIPG